MAITKRTYRTQKNRRVVFYQAEYFSKGIRIASCSFPKKKDAATWLLQQRNMNHQSPSTHLKMKLKQCIDLFFLDAQTRLMKSTLHSYSFQKKHVSNSPLGQLKMSEIKGIRIVEWLSWLRVQPTAKNPRRKSFGAELKFLSVILNWYKNFINEDFNVPVTKKHKQMCLFKKNSPRPLNYFIKPSDARKWVKWLKKNRAPHYGQLAIFMLSTGMRVGEACGLYWNDIDFEQGTAWLIRKVKWDHVTRQARLENFTKTSGERVILIPKDLLKILIYVKKKSKNSLVFSDQNGDLLKYSSIQSSFNSGFRALNLPWRSTHICRHTYATIALMATKNFPAVQASLGHKEWRTTQRYAKVVALLNSKLGDKTFSRLFRNQLSV